MTYKIILIDDHPLMRQGMRQILSLEDNIEVVGEASNGTEGVALALATEPDLIILDLNMKGISGLDTLRALRAKGVDARIVVLTVSDAQSDIFALMDAGVDGYLLKDSDTAELVENIQHALKGEMVLSDNVRQHILNRHCIRLPIVSAMYYSGLPPVCRTNKLPPNFLFRKKQ